MEGGLKITWKNHDLIFGRSIPSYGDDWPEGANKKISKCRAVPNSKVRFGPALKFGWWGDVPGQKTDVSDVCWATSGFEVGRSASCIRSPGVEQQIGGECWLPEYPELESSVRFGSRVRIIGRCIMCASQPYEVALMFGPRDGRKFPLNNT